MHLNELESQQILGLFTGIFLSSSFEPQIRKIVEQVRVSEIFVFNYILPLVSSCLGMQSFYHIVIHECFQEVNELHGW